MRVVITGSTGLIGSRVVELLGNDFEFIPLTQEKVDITKKDSVERFLGEIEYDAFLHLAAYTDVDGAQTHKEEALAINVEGSRHLFECAARAQKKFIYISTDFVFDGLHPPYDEETKPNPLNHYGQTKWDGEKIVAGKAMIVRVSYPYRAQFEKKKDFFRGIRDRLAAAEELTMVADSLMTPTFVDDIAATLKVLIQKFSPQIYHVVGGDSMSPYEAAMKIASIWNYNPRLIKPTTYDEYFRTRAPRPRYSQMTSRKNQFHKMKPFARGLEAIKTQLSASA